MRSAFTFLLLLSLASIPGFAQNNGELLPPIYPVFFAANGITPAALGFVCTTTSGTSTPLATYSNAALTSANANPITLSAAGRAVSGATLIAVYLQSQAYRITVYAAGTGNTCNGMSVGTQLYQRDGVYTLGALYKESFLTKLDDKVCHASAYTGTSPDNAGGKFAACVTALPSTGGTVDLSGLEGAQSISADPFTAVTKNVTAIFGAGTYTSSVSLTIPSNITLAFRQGSLLAMGANTLTVNGAIDAPLTQIFSGTGSFSVGRNAVTNTAKLTRVAEVYPQWFGAKGNGTRLLDAAMTATSTTLAAVSAAFTTADVGKMAVVEGAGASSATLVTTITAIISGTQATLGAAASTTVSSVQAIYATDDTAALQTAVNSHFFVRLTTGIYGFTTLRLYALSQLVGNGEASTMLSRMDTGVGGATGNPALAMTAGQAAQSLRLTDFTVLCNQIGTNNDGIALGTEGSAFRYANNSWMNNVRVMSASGIGINIASNIGALGQIWAQNVAGQGTPAALSRPNSQGITVSDSDLTAALLSAEGRFELGEVNLGAGGSHIQHINVQPQGVYAGIDSITVSAAIQDIGSIFSSLLNGVAGTRRDLVRKISGAVRINIGNILVHPTVPVTVTNLVNDVTTGITHADWHSPFTSYQSLDFPAVTAQSQADLTIAMTGPRAGDSVLVTMPAGLAALGSVLMTGWVSANDQVIVRLINYSTSSSSNPAAFNVRVDVWPK